MFVCLFVFVVFRLFCFTNACLFVLFWFFFVLFLLIHGCLRYTFSDAWLDFVLYFALL